jgi:hypothetical protein
MLSSITSPMRADMAIELQRERRLDVEEVARSTRTPEAGARL